MRDGESRIFFVLAGQAPHWHAVPGLTNGFEFSELEKDRGDSEVAYKTSGVNSTEGIVALRGGESCANGNVSVHITNRPSG